MFFWPATLAGRFFVSGDALVYSYPLRTAAWEMIRQGQWPLWTPTLLSGYPLLSMAQLGLAYPLTWCYLFLSGHAAEQIYVLAPFFFAPLFTFLYARQIGRSRTAALLAGFSFGFGGLMASFLGTYGFLTNAVMWLPLTLIAIERARTRPLVRCLLLMTFSYAMSVLTGVGQGFLYVGIIAVAYAFTVTFVVRHSGKTDAGGRRSRFAPLLVALFGIVLAACLSAFQILETMPAQRLSIRSKLTYEMFSAGSFSLHEVWKSFAAPFYNYLDVTSFIVPLAALLALAAIVSRLRDWRVWFWLAVVVLGLLMMLGDHTPLYRLLYRLPVINLFRVPSRHAFEWTFALAMLAAFGWDAANEFFLRHKNSRPQPLATIFGGLLLASCAVTGFFWWRATRPIAGSPIQHTGMPEASWMVWKLCFTLLMVAALIWCWRLAASRQRSVLLLGVVLVGCFVEPYILLQRWWFHFAKPAEYFTQVSPPSRFLQQYAPQENRIFTSVTPGYDFNLPRTEPHNLTSRRSFHDAAGYEPLMLARYDKAFGNGGSFSTPNMGAPLDRQVLQSNWQVLDLLNVRFLAQFSAAPAGAIEKDGARFAVGLAAVELKAGAKLVLAGAAAPVDTLTIVSTLTNSNHLAGGQAVAKINVHTADGRIIERELQAGRDSSEWAHERADVKQNIKHPLARVFESRPGDDQNSFPAYQYWSRFDLGERLTIDRVEISNVDSIASIILVKTSAYDSADSRAFLLTQRLPENWRKVYDRDNVQIYENPRALPRTWMVPTAKVVTEEEALKAIRGESETPFNPREVALLEPPPLTKIGVGIDEAFSQAEAKITSYKPNSLTIEANSDKRAVLVVSEISYPGWEATIDGQPTTIFTANYLLRGVIVPEGKHRVEMHYTAPRAKLGGVISLLMLGALAVLFILSRKNAAHVN
ncbi:MAG TPA: YfhO family protein [Blastocatellia bacterium]|nr:YfhO family protein [Blastocatellia bacterium]